MFRLIKDLFYKKKHSPNQLWRDDCVSDCVPSSAKEGNHEIKPVSANHKPSKKSLKNKEIPPSLFRKLINLYPPYLGAGVKVRAIQEDWHQVEVRMHLKWYNRNAFGTHFGGSIYSMIDPHLALMLSNLLGRGYRVWDKSAHIEFVGATKKPIHCLIRIEPEELAEIVKLTEDGDKHFPKFELEIYDDDDQLIANVKKELYVRKVPSFL